MRRTSKTHQILIAQNLRFVKRFVSQQLSAILIEQLRELTRNFSLSLTCGDLLLLSGGWYVTHAGLIRLAKRWPLLWNAGPASSSIVRPGD